VEITTTLTTSRVNDVWSITTFIDFLPQVDYGQFTKISVVDLAPHRVTSDLRPRDLMVARLSWRLLDFLVYVVARGVLSMLVTVATPAILVMLVVVISLRVGSSSWCATSVTP
jgi:hypothetical protein